MSNVPSPSTSHSNLDLIFNAALRTYKKKTGSDITSHPLATELQSCDSPDAILAVLRRQIPTPDSSQSGHEPFAKFLVPTVNVLHTLSGTLGEGAGLVFIAMLSLLRIHTLTPFFQMFSPSKVISTGIGALLLVRYLLRHCGAHFDLCFQAAKDVNASQGALIDLFSRIEYFFRRLDIYIGVPPTTAMTDITAEIMAEVLIIIGMATKEVKRGRMSEFICAALRPLTSIRFRKVPEEVDRKHGHRGQSGKVGQVDTRRGSNGICRTAEDRTQRRRESDECRQEGTRHRG